MLLIKFLSQGSFFIVLFFAFPLSSFGENKIRILFEDEKVLDINLHFIQKIEYINLNDFAKIYNSKVHWYPITGKVSLSLQSKQIQFFIGTNKVILGSKKLRTKYTIRAIGESVYVPFEFMLSKDFANFAALELLWEPTLKTLTIEKRVNILQPRFYSSPGLTKIVFELSERLLYRVKKVTANSLKVEFIRGKCNERDYFIDNYAIQKILAKNYTNTSEFIITLKEPVESIKHTFQKKPLRLMVDIILQKKIFPTPVTGLVNLTGLLPEIQTTTGLVASTTAELSPQTTTEEIFPEIPVSTTAPKKPYIKRIVIDPGHGGHDPGAIGPTGIKEKDLNLIIAKEVTRLLKEDGYDVLLTREDDVFIPLVDRTDFANKNNADLFISIHCNASLKRDSQGWEIYFLSEKASDAEAAATAALENSVVQLEGEPTKEKIKLQELLWSLVVNEFMNEASELCSFITKEVLRRINIDNRGIKQANFYVLRGAQMPAVLIECAFLSNYREEKKLNTKQFQVQISDAIYSGIKEYDLLKQRTKLWVQ